MYEKTKTLKNKNNESKPPKRMENMKKPNKDIILKHRRYSRIVYQLLVFFADADSPLVALPGTLEELSQSYPILQRTQSLNLYLLENDSNVDSKVCKTKISLTSLHSSLSSQVSYLSNVAFEHSNAFSFLISELTFIFDENPDGASRLLR